MRTVDLFETLEPQDQKHLIFRLVKNMTVFRAPKSDQITAEVTWRLPAIQA